MKRKTNGWISILRGILLPLAAVATLLWFAMAVDSLNSGRSEEDLRQLEETLRREGADAPGDVFLLTLDETGQVFCVKKEAEA